MRVGIVGGGPVGLTLGLLLKKFNISFKLFEKHRGLNRGLISLPGRTLRLISNNGDILGDI